MKFYVGETINCSTTVKNASGAYIDPSTSINATVIRVSPSAVKINLAGMDKDATGFYHYLCQTEGYDIGSYKVLFKATDNVVIGITSDTFTLE